jgi:hypothetical protein
MNGEEFYNKFKDYLDALGPGWRGMKDVTVTGEIKFSYNGQEITLKMEP